MVIPFTCGLSYYLSMLSPIEVYQYRNYGGIKVSATDKWRTMVINPGDSGTKYLAKATYPGSTPVAIIIGAATAAKASPT